MGIGIFRISRSETLTGEIKPGLIVYNWVVVYDIVHIVLRSPIFPAFRIHIPGGGGIGIIAEVGEDVTIAVLVVSTVRTGIASVICAFD